MLTQIEIEVLKHVRSFRMTVPKAVAELFFDGVEAIAIGVLQGLQKKGYINTAELTPSLHFYHLCGKAAEALNVHRVEADPLSGTERIKAYGALCFCCMDGVYRPKMDSETFRTRFKALYHSGPKIDYYFTEGQMLGYLRIEHEHNSKGRPGRVLSNCWRDILKRTHGNKKNHRGVRAFQEIVANNRFIVMVLTGNEKRADRIRDEMHKMRERYFNYQGHQEAKALGYKRTAYHLHEAHRRWHRHDTEDNTRAAPHPPPPMDVKYLPDLAEVTNPEMQW